MEQYLIFSFVIFGLSFITLNFWFQVLTGFSIWQYKKVKESVKFLQDEHKERIKTLEIEYNKLNNKLQLQLEKEKVKLHKNLNALERELKREVDIEINLYQENQTEKAKELLNEKLNKINFIYKEKENKIKEKFLAEQEEILAKQEIVKENLIDLKAKETAAIEARIREYEEQNKQEFYQLQISSDDELELEELESIIPKLRNPRPLRQAIFNMYYRNNVKDLVNRVTKGNRVSGIYKITHLATGMCYIGQSVDIGNRWMQHCKRGAGVDDATTIKLYPAMRKHGIHSFKFEIIEEVTIKKLSEREKYWGSYFGAKVFGYSIKN